MALYTLKKVLTKRCICLALALLLVLPLFGFPIVLRFEHDPMNYYWVIGTILGLLALLAVPMEWGSLKSTMKNMLLLLLPAAGAAAVIGLVYFNYWFSFRDGENLTRVEIDTVEYQETNYVLYRTDCGATCSWGLLVRRETPVIPGFVNRVNSVWAKTPARDASFFVATDGSLALSIDAYDAAVPGFEVTIVEKGGV